MLPTRPGVERAAPGRSAVAPPPTVIPALTGIRAIALFTVLAYHLHEPMTMMFPRTTVLDPLMNWAFLALDVFFILSGFVLSYNYAERLADLTRQKYRDYLWARVGRIYPVHVLALVLMVISVLIFLPDWIPPSMFAFGDATVGAFVGALLMLQGIPGIGDWNGPAWSISCEFAAYLIFPLACGVLARRSRRSALVVAAVISGVLLAVISVFMLRGDVPLHAFHWIRIATEFPLGCLLWAAWRHTAWRGWAGDVTAVSMLLCALLLVLGLPGSPLAWLAVPCLAAGVAGVAGARGPVARFLASSPVEGTGRISYSVYLVHVPVLLVFYVTVPYQELTRASPWLQGLVLAGYLAAPLLAGLLVYRCVEEPARRWLRRRARSRAVAEPDPVPSCP